MLQANFTVSPSSGYVLATQYTVTNLTTSDSTIQQYNWDSGTGEIQYNVTTPVFIYKAPGTYNISLTARDYNGSTSSYTQSVFVDLRYRDYITFSQIPNSYANPGLPTDEPFEISVISSNPNSPLIVDLYAANSLSTPLEYVPSKWNFLTPTWHFTDVNSNIIKSLIVPSTPVYVNGVVVAVSGTAKFYYVDSMSTGNPVDNCPLLITATLQTSGFSNFTDSNIYAYPSYANNASTKVGITWQVNDLIPNLLKVTGNYIDNIYFNQYNGIKIPTLITYHGNRANVLPGGSNTTSEVLFSYPPSNNIGNISPILLSLSGVPSTSYSLEQTPLYAQSTDTNGAIIGGYVFTSLTPLSTINSTTIVAKTTAYSNDIDTGRIFPYPHGYVPNPSVWVSNPEQNTLNKITVTPYSSNCNSIINYKTSNALLDGYIKQVSVPPVTSTSTFNYNMSGFSGVYGIAVDPRDYSVVVADAEADYLYRFTNTGILTSSFSFNNIDNFNPFRTVFLRDTFTVSTPYLSSTPYKLTKIDPASNNIYNYLVTLNGVVQPPDTYKIDNQNFSFTVSDSTPSPDSVLNVTEIFSTSLSSDYISTIQYWTSASNVPASVFPLTGTPNLSADSSYYIVTVDGIMQSPTTYTIIPSTYTINFSETVLANLLVQVFYLPKLKNPYTWTYNFSVPTKTVSISSNSFYVSDSTKSFLVNVGGVYQGTLNYIVDVVNSQLVFDDVLPINTDIIVTYANISQAANNIYAYTPANVSIDSNYNIWVSLFNDIDVVKFDSNFNVLTITNPAKFVGFDPATTDPADLDDKGDYLVKPPTLETDKNNNCWVTYSYPLCCLLVKYNTLGVPLTAINLPVNSVPASLTIDNNNNIWVSNSYNSTYNTPGNIQLYSGTNYTLMSSITGIPRPGEISLNRDGNLWFTHSIRGIGYIDTKTGKVSLWYNDSNNGTLLTTLTGNITNQSYTTSAVDVYTNDEEYSSLAVDVYDRLWYIDSYNNNVNVLLSAVPQVVNTDNSIRSISIIPNNFTGYYIDPNSKSTFTVTTTSEHRSAQAVGDWTGNKWYQKYTKLNTLSSVAISGTSTPFTVADFNNPNQIKRINDSFNTAAYYKALALPENLNSDTVLFDQFFAAAVGTGTLSANEDLGQVVYERTANFIQNHSDIDTCLTDRLLNLAETVDIKPFIYATYYPHDIKNMLDIASTPKDKLWGVQDQVPLMPESVGPQYDTYTNYVTAGTKIVLQSKFDSSLSIVQVPPLNGLTAYPLSQYQGYGFVQPVYQNYNIFQFVPVYNNNFINNIIDWNTDQTTLLPTNSSFNAWYGDNGIIENTFRYLLTKNLFLK